MQQTLSNSIKAAQEKMNYDAHVKEVIANKHILAWILKYATKEFKKYTIEEIEHCIEQPRVASESIFPGLTNTDNITGLSNENAVANEGTIYFDIRFNAFTPEKEVVKIIVNVEAQNKYNPGYDLVTRGIFYNARQLSAQLEREFSLKTEDKIKYDNIKKVYSIWLCLRCPNYMKNTITSYDIKPTKLYGNFTGNARYDLMSVVMVGLDENLVQRNAEECSDFLRMLSILLSNIAFQEKKELLKDYHIPMESQFGEEVSLMCNLSEGVMQDGIEQGRREGIIALVESFRDINQSDECIIGKLIEKFNLTKEEAKEYL